MRIAFITASVSRKAGGLFESVRRLAQSMEREAAYVEVFTLEDADTGADRSCWEPVPISAFRVRGAWQFGFAPRLTTALVKSEASLLMSHGIWMYPSTVAHGWHKKTGRPYIVHPHGMLDRWAVRNSAWKKRLAWAFYERAHLREAACIRALCQSEADSIRAYGLKNPICVVPNGIDLPNEDHGPRTTDHGLSTGLKADGRKVLLYLGRIHPKKGLLNLIEAWGRISREQRAKTEEWVLAIAGWDQGGHEAELKNLATQLKISWTDVREERFENSQLSTFNSQLVFPGPQFGDDKAAWHRDCDAFILPSFSEGLPMAVLEAWAYAKPVLMTPQCNLPEGFAADAAIRIEPRAESIARGLQELFSAPSAVLQALGIKGRALVAERFAWPKIATEMKSVCEWVLGGRPKPACVRDRE